MTHDWEVYSTVIEGHSILVRDRKSGLRGSIDNPTPEEWSRAFHAPSEPYLWHDASRVVIDESPMAA